MSEPIRLYGKDGQEGYAYGQAQRRAMLDSGEWFATAAEAGAGVVETNATESPAPAAKVQPAPKTTPRKGSR